MSLGLPVALALAAQAAAEPASLMPQPEPSPSQRSDAAPARPAGSADACRTTRPDANTREIVICAPRTEGYRIDPDVLAVKKLKRSGGRPTRPGPEGIKDTSRCVVGPAGCQTAGINIIGATLTAAEMASRLSKGQEVGSMFVTDRQSTEYQLYLEAKAAREAKEAEKKASAIAKAAAAKAAAAEAEKAAPESNPTRQ